MEKGKKKKITKPPHGRSPSPSPHALVVSTQKRNREETRLGLLYKLHDFDISWVFFQDFEFDLFLAFVDYFRRPLSLFALFSCGFLSDPCQSFDL